MGVASHAQRLPQNAAGDLYVDATCIDCGMCRWLAPATFDEQDDLSYVRRQPETADETKLALMALVGCPTGSIGSERKPDLAPIVASFPTSIDDGVFYCGFHAEASFGATSYLIVREAGNVLVDTPRFTRLLVERIAEMGGVATIFLTHRDDVADHAKWAARFGARRILHADDVSDGTRDVEHKLEGEAPISLAEDLLAIPTPGHTRGSMCLLYRDKFLFSGDHLAWSRRRGHPVAFRDACWYDWRVLRRSMERLLAFRFEWVLPGHGERFRFPSSEMPAQMQRCLDWMTTA